MSESSIPILPSCADPVERDSLSVNQARQRILDSIAPLSGAERLAIRQALGRVLLNDVISPIDVPPRTNSAMDGYAVRGADLPQAGETRLRIVGSSYAGVPFGAELHPGEAVRIMTGGVMPTGSDTVVIQERVAAEGDVLRVGEGERSGQNVRGAGEDLARGQVALPAGRQLTPADIGLLASLGFAETSVRRRPRVAFLSTGDELRGIGTPLREGQIYDSNRYTLHAMLTRMGADLQDLGVVRDDRQALEEALTAAARSADVVISTGGVSVGEADFTREILARLGQVGFWKIAMKPGRPLAFGQLNKARFFGLPGNPVAVMVTFHQFVRPALRRLAGMEADEAFGRLTAVCTERLRKRAGRTEFPRGILESRADGTLSVSTTGRQGSGILRSMSLANCFIVLPAERDTVEAGQTVQVELFQGML